MTKISDFLRSSYAGSTRVSIFFEGWIARSSGAKTALRAFCPAMTKLGINTDNDPT